MNILFGALFGIVTWPIMEYLLHRFVGHVWKLDTLFKKEHSRHHREVHYFAPLTYKSIAAVPALGALFAAVFALTASWRVGLGFTLGFAVMFSFYEWFHWACHSRAPKTRLGLRLLKHHLAHHFHNTKMNHGVTSIWIDRLAGTYQEYPVIKVPKAFPLPWLMDEGKSGVNGTYAKDFQLR